ncbi:MAG: hypothetical protein ABJL99_08720 [Aliishimia sp.]
MTEKVVLSLSTIPPRFGLLADSLNSLLHQKKQADEIHVYVPTHYKRFPEHEFRVPDVPEGVVVKVVDEDYGPATKVLPCARAHRGTQTRIVYCDDDRFADPNWLKALLDASLQRKDDVVVSAGCQMSLYDIDLDQPTFLPRAVERNMRKDANYLVSRLKQKISELVKQRKLPKPTRAYYEDAGYVDIAMGVGGVSVRPDFFDDLCFEIPPVLWAVDDIWLSGSFARQGIGIWADNTVRMPTGTSASQTADLASSVIEDHGRAAADRRCIAYMQKTFGVWT